MSVVKLATLVEGYPKGPFSIITTQRCSGGGTTAFPGLHYFTHHTYLLYCRVLSKAASSAIWVFGMTRETIMYIYNDFTDLDVTVTI